jgi:hypothetical protein
MSKRVSRDPLNGKDYIMQAVAWFIKKVSAKSPVRLYLLTFSRASR